MKILRVFNNNVVLAQDGEREVILTGRGLGFQARQGQEVDPAAVVRVFVPQDGRDPDHLGELLTDVDPEHITLVTSAMTAVGLDENATSSPTLVMALADHLGAALRRLARGTHVDYPLEAEVRHLYPQEYATAERLVAELNTAEGVDLPVQEATALAMHLVGAGFTSGDLSFTYRMTGVIQQLLEVVASSHGIKLDTSTVNVGRFITHLRYLFVRIQQHEQLDTPASPITAAIHQTYPRALQTSQRLAQIIELRMDATLTADEVAYLTLHVSRMTSD